mmetsp:Transcript_3394/g.10498  ORF Transcript_3394/g.10498 Transcript_3394/m.10498 type:complete len:202 (-) Transcript_3394:22-627(-)
MVEGPRLQRQVRLLPVPGQHVRRERRGPLEPDRIPSAQARRRRLLAEQFGRSAGERARPAGQGVVHGRRQDVRSHVPGAVVRGGRGPGLRARRLQGRHAAGAVRGRVPLHAGKGRLREQRGPPERGGRGRAQGRPRPRRLLRHRQRVPRGWRDGRGRVRGGRRERETRMEGRLRFGGVVPARDHRQVRQLRPEQDVVAVLG